MKITTSSVRSYGPLWFAGLFAVGMLVVAAIGGYRAYLPLPYMDMWDGYRRFFLQARDGELGVWWSQHNEHRIVLARLLFWADLTWFQGASYFLIVVNYVLIGCSACLMWRLCRAMLASPQPTQSESVAALLLCGWLFQWMQYENFISAFQSQFILAQLLPLMAFYLLHKSTAGQYRERYFVAACSCGLAAVGAMANGVLALPLMAVYALALRHGWRRSLILSTLSVAAISVYFHGYQTPVAHGSVLAALTQHPLGTLQYVLYYMGSPFYFLALHSTVAAGMAGAAFLLFSVLALLRTLRRPSANSLSLALLLFLIYVAVTALGTASWRLSFGLEQAFSSRYTTPTIMAWAVLAVLYLPQLLTAARRWRRIFWLPPLLALVCLMLTLQLRALPRHDGEMFERKIAGLALALGVRDTEQIKQVYPFTDLALQLAQQASASKLSVFGHYPLDGLSAGLGQVRLYPPAPACEGALDRVEILTGDERYVQLRGWLRIPEGQALPARLDFSDKAGRVTGYALTLPERKRGWGNSIEKRRVIRFAGYVLAENAGAVMSLRARRDSCQMSLSLPPLLFSKAPALPSAELATVSSNAVLADGQWSGGDFERSVYAGMRIYGSFIHGDSDTGTFTITLHHGDRLFYRSGPTAGRQRLTVVGYPGLSRPLPVAEAWTLLDFSGKGVPDGNFVVQLTDGGDRWGEWSAIAVKNDAKIDDKKY